jgi:isochorismate synthase
MGPLHMTSASTDNSFETHLYVSLRCMKITGNDCTLYAGGGLLRDSVLDQEWHETEVKMQTMKALFK